MSTTVKQNKMGTMPVFKLLISMALPLVISMLIQSLYNVVDSIYVGKFSKEALNAIGLAFPMQNLIIAMSTGTGVGINAVLSKSLGENNKHKASSTAINGCFIVFVIYLMFLVVGLTLIPTKVYFIGALVKVEFAIAKGKKLYDKREDFAKRDSARKMDRAFKEHNNQ